MNKQEWLPTVCYMCYNHCGIKVRRANGLVVEIKGQENNPGTCGKVCAKGKAGVMGFYDPYRVTVPLKRTNPEKGLGIDPGWVEITWEEALDTIVENIKRIKEDNPKKLVVAGLDYAAGAFQWAFSTAFGTPNRPYAAAYFCGNPLHLTHYMHEGAFFAEVDFHRCNYCILMGTQQGFMVEGSPGLAQMMADARARGMKVVVIDPVCTNAAAKADEWIPIRPGTDAALALALINLLINELGTYDAEFIRRYTNGPYLIGPDGHYVKDEAGQPLMWDMALGKARPYDAFDGDSAALEGSFQVGAVSCQPAFQLLKEHVKRYTVPFASEITGIPEETIQRLAKEISHHASIGSKIVLEGAELPLRPVALAWKRGSEAHRHGGLAGLAMNLVNIILGAVDVPGGLLGHRTVTPFGGAEAHEDGLIWPGKPQRFLALPFPAREVKRPESYLLLELLPVTTQPCPLFEEAMNEPEKYQLPYQPEMMLHITSNLMMSTLNPQKMGQAFSKLGLVVSFALYLDETVEYADIVLPDAHYLERLVPFPNFRSTGMIVGTTPWYFPVAQPVAGPPGQVRFWPEVLLEIAERAGFLKDILVALNLHYDLKGPFFLEPDKKYTLREISENWIKSIAGPERGLDWFQEHGVVLFPKKIEEAYPRLFITGRTPIYAEHFIKAGQEVKKVTQEMGIPWDTEDYQPLPDWKPCDSHGPIKEGRDLFAVNYKVSFHTFTFTAQNPWLNELAEHHPYAYKVMINPEVARSKGIEEGDTIWVESEAGRVKGQAKLTQCVEKETVALAGIFGHWAAGMPVAKGKGPHFNTLLPCRLDRIDPVAAGVDACVRVKVYKA